MTNTERELVDRLRIGELPLRYSAAIDAADWLGMQEYLTDDAVFIAGDARFEGAAAIAAMTSAGLTGLDHSQHFISNVVVDIHGDRASVTSYLQAQHVKAGAEGDGATYLVGGVFRDTAVRTGDTWRFSERNLEVYWDEGNPAVHP